MSAALSSTSGTDEDYTADNVYRRTYPPLVVAVCGAACLIILGEIDRLIASSVGTGGLSRPLSSYIGIGGFAASDSWDVWSSAAARGIPINLWIGLSAAFDVVFILCYSHLLLRICRLGPLLAEWGNWSQEGDSKFVRRFILLLVLGDIAENVMLLIGAFSPATYAGAADWWWPWLFCGVKWVMAAITVLVMLRNKTIRTEVIKYVSMFAHSVYTHRLGLAVLGILCMLSLIPSGNIFDQLPDVQRQWLDGGWTGFWHAFWAFVGAIILSIAFYIIGRHRSHMEWEKYVKENPPVAKAKPTWWIAAFTFVFFGVVVVDLLMDRFEPVFLWYLAVPSLVLIFFVAAFRPNLEIRMEAYRTRRNDDMLDQLHDRTPEEKKAHKQRAYFTRITGDVLAVLLVCVSALGLVRAFTAPVVLALTKSLPGANLALLSWSGILFACGCLGAGMTAVLGMWLTQQSDVDATSPSRLCRILVVVSSLFLLGSAFFPSHFAGFFGTAAMTLAALGAWSLLIGAIVISLQEQRPPLVFDWARFRAVPVLTLLFIVPFLMNLNGGVAAVHAIRSTDPDGATGVEKALDATVASTSASGPQTLTGKVIDPAWASWESRSNKSCDTSFKAPPATGSASDQDGAAAYVRPVLLVAAQGGGIRAAYWAGRTMEALSESAPCIANSVLLSSGVSGGSVGLVVAGTAGENTKKGAITSSLEELSDSRTLATALTAYLTVDGIAAISGWRLPSEADGSFSWHDRAAHIEMAWESRETSLKNLFSPSPTKLTGALLLNSTDSVSGCRVIVAQQGNIAALASEPTERPKDVDCNSASLGAAAAVSLEHLTGSASCAGDLRWSTAAMLSARFPFVTPAGRLPGGEGNCASPDVTQLVDGGYADNTGLATLFDMVPEIRAKIWQYNATATGAQDKPFVFPVLLYAENSLGGDIKAESRMTAEFLMPLTDQKVKEKQVASAAWIQRISSGLDNVCPPMNSACASAHSGFESAVPSGAVVVSPSTRPAIAPPLGWTLSGFSRSNLCDALADEVSKKGTMGSFGRLGDLFSLTTMSESVKCSGN